MAWQIVGVANNVEVVTASHALVTTGISGLQDGDLLVACISSRIASATPVTLPSGWALVGQVNNSNTATTTSAAPSATMAWIRRGASDPSLTFTHPTTPSVAIGRIVAYRNINNPILLADSLSGSTGTNTTICSWGNQYSSMVPSQDLIVAMIAGGQEATWSNFSALTTPSVVSGATDTSTQPTLNTCIERCDNNTTTGADTSIAIFDGIPNAATSGNFGATASQGAVHCLVTGLFRYAQLDIIMPPMRPPNQ